MKTRMEKSICDWWSGPCLFEVLDSIEVPPRDPNGPVRYDATLFSPLTFNYFYTISNKVDCTFHGIK